MIRTSRVIRPVGHFLASRNKTCTTTFTASITTTARYVNWWRIPVSDVVPTENVQQFYENLDKTIFSFHKMCPYTVFSQPGIYKLTNNKTGMVYVGMSTDMYRRIKQHVKDAFNYKYATDKDVNKRFSLVSMAIAESNFDFKYEILERVPRSSFTYDDRELRNELKKKESFYIHKFKSFRRDVGYNVVK